MLKQSISIITASIIILTACQQKSAQENKEQEKTATEIITPNPLIGSWVEPNPINEKEVQGIILNEDGTAVSINMATLVFKKWWKQNDELVLVSESVGNKLTIVDTSTYQIVKINQQELELKNGDYTVKYRRQ